MTAHNILDMKLDVLRN